MQAFADPLAYVAIENNFEINFEILESFFRSSSI